MRTLRLANRKQAAFFDTNLTDEEIVSVWQTCVDRVGFDFLRLLDRQSTIAGSKRKSIKWFLGADSVAINWFLGEDAVTPEQGLTFDQFATIFEQMFKVAMRNAMGDKKSVFARAVDDPSTRLGTQLEDELHRFKVSRMRELGIDEGNFAYSEIDHKWVCHALPITDDFDQVGRHCVG